MELLLLLCLCLCLLSCSGDAVRVVVEEGSDAVLPCSPSTKVDLSRVTFWWKKNGQKNVFIYDSGLHYNLDFTDQDEQFRGRVSHFQDELQNGNASIKIRNIKMADSGIYSCDFPNLQPSQTFNIELVVVPVLKDRTGENIPGPFQVFVEEGSDVVLPCLISTKRNIAGKFFEWKKDGQRVFFYDPAGQTIQSEQFKGRVSHFQDQLMNGDASIKINNTKMEDSGIYSCIFPNLQPSQTFNIELVVGAAPRPIVNILAVTKEGVQLQCEAHGVPRPTVEWKDSENDIVPAEVPQISEDERYSYVAVNITVTKADNYRCVATQETLSHQVAAVTSVYIQGPNTGLVATIVVLSILLVGGVVFYFKDRIRQICAKDPVSRPNTIQFQDQTRPTDSERLN